MRSVSEDLFQESLILRSVSGDLFLKICFFGSVSGDLFQFFGDLLLKLCLRRSVSGDLFQTLSVNHQECLSRMKYFNGEVDLSMKIQEQDCFTALAVYSDANVPLMFQFCGHFASLRIFFVLSVLKHKLSEENMMLI